MTPMRGEPPVLILVAVQELVNLASCMRVAKNFGIEQVRLVAPECEVDFYRIEGVAHHTGDVLDRLTVHATLDEASADLVCLFGLTGRERTAKRSMLRPRDAAQQLLQRGVGGPVGLLAGREDHGLRNDELDHCDALVTISANPEYNSLNLAQAVAVQCHELWVARGGDEIQFKPPRRDAPAASHADLEVLFGDWERALERLDFFKARPRALVMRTMRELVYRAVPDTREAALWRAIGLEIGNVLDRRASE